MRSTPGFHIRAVTIGPGGERAYDGGEWCDALVIVRYGQVELECVTGGRPRLAAGAVLWLAGLPLRALHNPGREPTVLVAISRR
jgi:hypothetical protein